MPNEEEPVHYILLAGEFLKVTRGGERHFHQPTEGSETYYQLPEDLSDANTGDRVSFVDTSSKLISITLSIVSCPWCLMPVIVVPDK